MRAQIQKHAVKIHKLAILSCAQSFVFPIFPCKTCDPNLVGVSLQTRNKGHLFSHRYALCAMVAHFGPKTLKFGGLGSLQVESIGIPSGNPDV